MPRYYTGVGSRVIPEIFINEIKFISESLSSRFILRSGGATGSDKAFESGVIKMCNSPYPMEIYLPRYNFNNCPSTPEYIVPEFSKSVVDMALHYYHSSSFPDDSTMLFMTRNLFQVLGRNLNTPSEFVLLYKDRYTLDRSKNTKNVAGGTGQAVRVAYDYNIPIYNLAYSKDSNRFYSRYM